MFLGVGQDIGGRDGHGMRCGATSLVVLIEATQSDSTYYEHCNTIQTLLKSPFAASDSRIQK